MKKHIPNLITGMNVLSGTLAIFVATMYGKLELAAALIVVGLIFDFFDGMAARLLHVKSEMGKELDSLADMVTFGIAPAVLAHLLIRMTLFGGEEDDFAGLTVLQQIMLFVPLIIPVFSAFRLAKFNLDVRQTMSFIGMPTPANALFWVGLVYGYYHTSAIYGHLFDSVWTLAACVVVLSVLLVCELPMFSLKITGFSWKENKIRYIYFMLLIILAIILGKAAVMFVIPLYVLFTVVTALITSLPTRRIR